MKKTHTPGPWTPNGNYILSSCKNFHVALMTRSDADMADEWKANKNLIAAAPELLDALEGMLKATGNQAIYNFMSRQRNAAMQAVAKATGQTP